LIFLQAPGGSLNFKSLSKTIHSAGYLATARYKSEDRSMEQIMNFTEEQQQAVENGEAVPINIGNSECVVLRKDIYDRVKGIIYDGSQISDETAALLGWESGKGIGWESPEMAEYDDYDLHRTRQE
jgi:hypothetical protein